MTVLINPYRFAAAGGGGGGYAAAVLADGPVGYWRFGEATGTVAADETATGNDGTYSGVTLGATGLLAGDADTAAEFVIASSSVVTIPNHATYPDGTINGGDSTWEMLFKVDANRDFNCLWQYESASNLGYPDVYTISSGKIRFYWLSQFFDSTVTLTVGQTYHLAFVYDSSLPQLRAYIDGVLDSSLTPSFSMPSSNAFPIRVGRRGDGATQMDGVIDEFAVYDKALTATQIADHYTATGL